MVVNKKQGQNWLYKTTLVQEGELEMIQQCNCESMEIQNTVLTSKLELNFESVISWTH